MGLRRGVSFQATALVSSDSRQLLLIGRNWTVAKVTNRELSSAEVWGCDVAAPNS